MRKSNLLILILGALLIVGFVTTQAMLKARFNAGKFVNNQVLWDEEHVQRAEGNYKVLYLKNIEDAAYEVSNESVVYLQKGIDTTNYTFESRGDTLFISYNRQGRNDFYFKGGGRGSEMEVRGPHSLSVICDSSVLIIRPVKEKNIKLVQAQLRAGSSLELGREYDDKKMSYLEVDSVDVIANNAALVINQFINIRSVNAILEGKSKIDIKCDSIPIFNLKYSENSLLQLPGSLLKEIQ